MRLLHYLMLVSAQHGRSSLAISTASAAPTARRLNPWSSPLSAGDIAVTAIQGDISPTKNFGLVVLREGGLLHLLRQQPLRRADAARLQALPPRRRVRLPACADTKLSPAMSRMGGAPGAMVMNQKVQREQGRQVEMVIQRQDAMYERMAGFIEGTDAKLEEQAAAWQHLQRNFVVQQQVGQRS